MWERDGHFHIFNHPFGVANIKGLTKAGKTWLFLSHQVQVPAASQNRMVLDTNNNLKEFSLNPQCWKIGTKYIHYTYSTCLLPCPDRFHVGSWVISEIREGFSCLGLVLLSACTITQIVSTPTWRWLEMEVRIILHPWLPHQHESKDLLCW